MVKNDRYVLMYFEQQYNSADWLSVIRLFLT